MTSQGSILMERSKKATPNEWVCFYTASLVMKTIRNEEHKPLFNLLHDNYFEESRKPQVGYFLDDSKTLLGRQLLQNRLMFMRSITDPWNNKYQPMSDNAIRIMSKKALFEYYTQKVEVLI